MTCVHCNQPAVGLFRLRGLLIEVPVCASYAREIEEVLRKRIDYFEAA